MLHHVTNCELYTEGEGQIYVTLLVGFFDLVAPLDLISSTNMRKANLSICILKF